MVLVALCLIASGCKDDIDPVVEDLALDRVLTPTNLTARIRNLTTVELSWNADERVDHYVVEFSEDSLEFNTIVFTDDVTADELPYQHVFAGETLYSARVKAVVEGEPDSKWTAVTIETAQENIFLALEDGDIEATQVTLRWPANSEVTHFIINPGNIQRNITTEEKEAGEAVITGLTGETDYTIQLKNNAKNRGLVEFETLVDIGDATAVYPEDNLADMIAAAEDGATLVLFPGDYTVNAGASIVINKSIALKGQLPGNKPMLHVQFTIASGATDVEFKDIDLDGDGTLANVFEYTSAGVDYGTLTMNGCTIHDFTARLVYGNVASKVAAVVIDNSVLTNVDAANGGDFIDFRTTYLASATITNSTFDRCAPGRDFVRLDAAAAYTGTGLTSTVLIDHCTFYGVSNTQDRILYVRFNANVLTVQNSLFAATDGYYTNQAATTQPTCANNNYFNAVGFFTPAYVTNAKTDVSGNHTTLDPGFVNAAAGDFTITNQTLIDNAVGDPRWRP